MAAGAFRGRREEAVTVWLVFTGSFRLVSGGRYSDPTEMAKYAVPFTIAAVIFIGMIGLLCYFMRHEIRKRCPCLPGATGRMNISQRMNQSNRSTSNQNNQVTITTLVRATTSQYTHTGKSNGTLPQSSCDPQISKDQKVHHLLCSGCGSLYSKDQGQVKDNQSDNNRSTRTAAQRFLAFFKPKRSTSNAPSNDKSEGFTDGMGFTCENCYQMKHLRRALKDQDITNVCLMLETSDACHI